ncbi:sigma E protease regulator RseP [Shewanella marina]|uniref:sigma E protease regulator RseP n=1 Tax=Shewanella marina TaxID=487319 RepID=UPI00046EC269|nr:sigma E protease regulator RseP [Shewanella marina]
MVDIIWNFAAFVVALGILIAAHEFGHFYVARRCGVKVERFSIGFGKAIWRKVGKDGTEYVLALIPLGGYVKMLDERVEDVPDELKSQAFNRKTVWQRIAIVAAGPIANFIFAIIALYVMYLIGVNSIKPVITETKLDTPAASIQVKQPQQIISVGGQSVRNWEEVNLALVSHIGDKQVSVTVAPLDRSDDIGAKTYQLDISHWNFDPDKQLPITAIGLVPFQPKIEPVLALVSEDGAGHKAGLLVGDTLVALNGQPYTTWQSFVDVVKASANIPLELTIRRNGEQFNVKLTPQSREGRNGQVEGVIGIAPKQLAWPENLKIDIRYGVLESATMAVDKTWQLISVSGKMIAKLFTGDVSVKNLSGPISIAQGAGHSADIGFVYFLSFLALISVNLGIINLLPLPVLDGGHLLYYFIEVITGRPVPEKVQDIGFRFGAAMLLIFMSIAIFNDFARL